jgi:hypothetical protein
MTGEVIGVLKGMALNGMVLKGVVLKAALPEKAPVTLSGVPPEELPAGPRIGEIRIRWGFDWTSARDSCSQGPRLRLTKSDLPASARQRRGGRPP